MLIKTDENQVPIKEQELVNLTRHTNLQSEVDHLARERAPLTPDAAGMDVTHAEQRAGRPMSSWSMQEKLQKIAPFLYFEKSNNDPTKIGIYIKVHGYDPKLYKGSLLFICGMGAGVIPEFSVIEAEAHTVPDPEAIGGHRVEMGMAQEIRGWRTVLAILLKKRIISAGSIEKYFQITLGRDSQRWHELLMGSFDLVSTETEDSVHVGESRGEAEGEVGAERGGIRPYGDERGRPEDVHQSEPGGSPDDHSGSESPGSGDSGQEGIRQDPPPADHGGEPAHREH